MIERCMYYVKDGRPCGYLLGHPDGQHRQLEVAG